MQQSLVVEVAMPGMVLYRFQKQLHPLFQKSHFLFLTFEINEHLKKFLKILLKYKVKMSITKEWNGH